MDFAGAFARAGAPEEENGGRWRVAKWIDLNPLRDAPPLSQEPEGAVSDASKVCGRLAGETRCPSALGWLNLLV